MVSFQEVCLIILHLLGPNIMSLGVSPCFHPAEVLDPSERLTQAQESMVTESTCTWDLYMAGFS